MKRIFTLLCLLVFGGQVISQNIIEVSGRAEMRMDPSMSENQLKEKLREEAILNAIESQFGTVVERVSYIDIVDGQTFFNIKGENSVRGEWLKTTHERYVEESRKVKTDQGKKNEQWIRCEVTGLARELAKPMVDLNFQTLNCPEKVCRTIDFYNSEPLYFYFQSAKDGYLSLFMHEQDGQVYRLLPYQNMPMKYQNAIPISSDREYVFFSSSPKHSYFADFSNDLIDELIMATNTEVEQLTLYVVFSTNEFQKPALNMMAKEEESGLILPKSLNYRDFKEWLQENRIRNVDFYYRKVPITIRN